MPTRSRPPRRPLLCELTYSDEDPDAAVHAVAVGLRRYELVNRHDVFAWVARERRRPRPSTPPHLSPDGRR